MYTHWDEASLTNVRSGVASFSHVFVARYEMKCSPEYPGRVGAYGQYCRFKKAQSSSPCHSSMSGDGDGYVARRFPP